VSNDRLHASAVFWYHEAGVFRVEVAVTEHAGQAVVPTPLIRTITATVVAVRAPILAAVLYFVFLVLPDQTAEAIRSTFEADGWTLFGILAGWFVFTFYLVLAFLGASLISIDQLFVDHPEKEFGLFQRLVVYLVAATPIVALVIAVVKSTNSLWNPAVLIFLLLVALIAASIWLGSKGQLVRRERDAWWGYVLGGGLFLAFVLAALRIGSWASGVTLDPPPVLILTGWMTIALAILMALEYLSNQSGWPVFSLLVIWALLLATFGCSDNHLVRTVERDPNERGTAKRLDVATAFDQWIERRAPKIKEFNDSGRSYPVFLIAAEGGGSRAAFMTTLVLEALRTHCPDAIRHTFLIAGVSGGSVGAVLANAGSTWQGVEGPCKEGPPSSPDTTAAKAAGFDLMRPALRGLLFGDIPARILPEGLAPAIIASFTDPAQYLEVGMDRAWREYDKSEQRDQHKLADIGFAKLWKGPAGDVPALVLLTTDVASGRRVAVSHFATRPVAGAPPADGAKDGPGKGTGTQRCTEAKAYEELDSRVRLLTLDDLVTPPIEVPAATAAILSARFPGVTAAGRLPCEGPVQRLVDGGYFENSGLTTVLEVREELRKRNHAGVTFVIVQIENSRATSDWSFAEGDPPPPPDSWLPGLMSPFRALAGTRQARGDLARLALRRTVPAAAACEDGSCDYRLLFELRPCRTPIPLGWSLSQAARDEVSRQLFNADAKGDEEACVGGVRTPAEARPPVASAANLATFEQIFRSVRQKQK
jgi:hypothetical protein